MVLGAPLMALFSRTWPRRRALLLFLAVFIAVHIVGALTPGYGVLLAARFVGALANAGFWAVALAAAVSMVPDGLRGRATAVVVSGVTIACVVGVPAGAVLGERWGWRAAFWAVAVVSLPALWAITRSVPAGVPGDRGRGGGTAPVADARGTASAGQEPEKAPAPAWTPTPARTPAPARTPTPIPVRDELRLLLTAPHLLPTLLTMALVQGATFCAFSYLEPFLTRTTGLTTTWVPVALALFGAGAFLGVGAAGRYAERRPTAFLAYGMAALALGWSALALTAGRPLAALALIPLLGMLAFGTGTALITRVLGLVGRSSTLAGAFGTSAFNLGAAVGPWAGGLALEAGGGYRSPVWVSAALMALALLTEGARRLRRVRSRKRASGSTAG